MQSRGGLLLFGLLLLLAVVAECRVLLQRPLQPRQSTLGPAPSFLPTAPSSQIDLVPNQPSGNYKDQLLRGYLTNDQLTAWSADYVQRCAKIARRFSIGKSVKGADLWVVEIAAKPGQVEAKPNFRYVANMHGDEPGGRMLLPMLAEWLCDNQAKDERAARIINDMHLFLLPSLNPDGFESRTRENAAGADLNRNFPSPFVVCAGTAPESCAPALLANAADYTLQPETAAVMAWALNSSFPFTAAANLHEGAVVANYPWDGYNDESTAVQGTNNLSPDNTMFVRMSEAYAQNHGTMSKSTEFPGGLTNGAAWYPAYGTLQDWSYTATGCMEITLELSDQKTPAASTFLSLWADNRDALLALPITAVLGGVSGQIRDAATRAAVPGAVLAVAGINKNITAQGPLAYYNKPLPPGNYSLLVSAPGYAPAAATVTVPSNGTGAALDFKLARSNNSVQQRPAAPLPQQTQQQPQAVPLPWQAQQQPQAAPPSQPGQQGSAPPMLLQGLPGLAVQQPQGAMGAGSSQFEAALRMRFQQALATQQQRQQLQQALRQQLAP